MKVLFLTHRLPYAPNRGDRIRAYYLLKQMSGFADVSLFSLVHDDAEQAHAAHVPFANRVETARVSRLLNLAKGVVGLPTRRPLTHALLDAPGVLPGLSKLIAESPPDVVVSFCSGMARFALDAPLEGRPFVLDMVDVDSGKWAAMADTSSGLRRWIYRREARTLAAFEALAVAQSAATLVVNERERQALGDLADSPKVRVVENGIDVSAFVSPDAPAAAPRLVFCGVMSYEPNDEGMRWFVKEIWPWVRAARSDATLSIVGGGATPALRQLCATDPAIELTGEVPSVQVYLWRAAVSIAPLRLARGLQNKVLEAIAAGLPVVATPAVFQGLPKEATSAVALADDPARFADAVLALLEQTPHERRARAATATLGALHWEKRLAQVEEILRETAL